MGYSVYRSMKPHLECILGVTFNETLMMATGGGVETTDFFSRPTYDVL